MSILPTGARVFHTVPGEKRPARVGAHHNAVEWVGEGVPEGNYGIDLTDTFVVVDFDRDHPQRKKWESLCQGTWVQKTQRPECEGRHYLFLLPEGVEGSNRPLRADDGQKLADVKCNGYIMGPGSVYEGRPYTYLGGAIKEAPEWLVEIITAKKTSNAPVDSDGWDAIPDGYRDDEMIAWAGFLRSRGLSETAIRRAVGSLLVNGLVEQPPGREMTQEDADRIARSAASYALGEGSGVIQAGVGCVGDLDLVLPVTEWVEYGFLPRAQLTMLYGQGGKGKSSTGSYWTAKETKRGNKVLVLAIEESIERFAFRSVLCGADRSKIYFVRDPHKLLLPRDADSLREYIADLEPSLVWIDAANSHIQQDLKGGNAATNVRKALEPLSIMAQDYGPAIVGVFHENKLGEYLGSVEMVNVARQVLHATRPKGRPLTLEVKKTNLRPPTHRLKFSGVEVTMTDPITGKTQMERNENDEVVPQTIVVATESERQSLDTEEDSPEDKGFVVLEDLGEPLGQKIADLYYLEPWLSVDEAAAKLGISRASYYRHKPDHLETPSI